MHLVRLCKLQLIKPSIHAYRYQHEFVSRNDFREAPDLNPHTVLQEITSAPTSSAQNQQDVKRMSSINGATPNSDPNTPKPLNINSPIPLYSFDQSPN